MLWERVAGEWRLSTAIFLYARIEMRGSLEKCTARHMYLFVIGRYRFGEFKKKANIYRICKQFIIIHLCIDYELIDDHEAKINS